MTLTRKDLDSGSAWQWSTSEGIDGTVVTHQVQLLDEAQAWVRWERVGTGGWTSRPAPELPIPADLDEAHEIVRGLVVSERRGK